MRWIRSALTALVLLALSVPVAAQSPVGGPRTAGLPSGPATLADLAYGRGLALLTQGQAADAARSLKLAVEGRPDHATYRLALANAYLATRVDDAVFLAVEEYQQALRLDPALDRAREGLARSAWMVGLGSITLAELERLFAGGPAVRMQYAAELASYYALSHEIDRGIATLGRALSRVADPNPLRLLMAALHMQKADKKGAQALVRRVLVEARPGSPIARQAEHMLRQGVGP